MSASELLVLVVAILAVWIVLKVARVAIRLIFVVISILILAGVLWFVFH